MTLLRESDAALIGGGDAVFSPDRLYRYSLTRQWSLARPMTLIMLNPALADAQRDDATIRRCLAFARRERCGSLEVVNLFALRSKDPAALRSHPEPVGEDNDVFIAAACPPGRLVVAAWGVHGAMFGRAAEVAAMLAARGVPLLCLGVTADGAPRHPLYVRGDQRLEPWPTWRAVTAP